MLRSILILVLLVILGVGGFFLYQSLQTKPAPQSTPTPQITKTPSPTQITPTTTPQAALTSCQILEQGNADVPSLYKEGVSWQRPSVTQYEVPLGEEGSRRMRGCLIKSQNIGTLKGRDIRIFYSGELIRLNWKPIVSADGVYSSVESYQKNSKYFVIQQKVAAGVILPTPSPDILIELFYSE